MSAKSVTPEFDANTDTDIEAELTSLCLEIVRMEAEEVANLENTLPASLTKSLALLNECAGHIMVIGIGKSGHVGRKIAATLSSTGSPAFFLHATEACHGDSGILSERDVVLAISQSGESNELLALLPLIRELNIPVVAITANKSSALGRNSNVIIDSSVKREACPHNLAPTTSTTVALVIGDVLAMCLLKMKGFTATDFARSHPAGALGRRLLLKVRDMMLIGEKIPRVFPDTLLSDAILEMSNKGLGLTAVVDNDNKILGVFTDGDLRRSLQDRKDVHLTKIGDCMTRQFHTIGADSPAFEGTYIMEDNKITALLVPDENQRLLGIVTMHMLIQSRLV